MRPWVSLALTGLLAIPLHAQSVRARLDGRIPSAAIPAVDSLIQFASQEGLPTEPLIQKALEGGAKHVAGPLIVAAVQLSLGQPRAEALAIVRRQLPNLPVPSKPTRGTVAGARRPATSEPP